MDTSEEYVLMCEKAIEIQKLMAIPVCQPYVLDSSRNLRIYGGEFVAITQGLVWLPRQDQLQEMICKEWVDYMNVYDRLFESLYWLDYKSMEQFWLAFVMKEKYHKIWNREDWIKEAK